MSDDQYFNLVLESKDGIATQWNTLEMENQCRYLENKATSKKYEDLKMVLTLPYSQHLIKLLIRSNEPLDNCKWLDLEFALEEMGDDKDFQTLKNKIFRHALRHINVGNCLSIWRKLLSMGSQLADEAFHFILYHLSESVLDKTICYQFYRLSFEQIFVILDHDKLKVRTEDDVLEIINAWIDTYDGRYLFRHKLLGAVRVAGLSGEKRKSFIDNRLIYLLSKKPRREPRDQMVMFGGWYNGRTHSRIDIFDEFSCEWKPLCEFALNYPVAYHGSVILNNELYVIGGTDGECHFSTVMKMNMKGEWLELAPMYETRTYISNSCCVLNGFIYVCGGFDVRTAHQRRRNERLRSVERYDPKLNKWEIMPSMNQMRSDCAAVSAGGKIYVSGGFSGLEVHDSVEVFTPLTNTWVEISYMPAPRSGHCMVLFGPETLLVIGGFDGQERMDTVFCWRIGHLRWGFYPSMRSSRSNFSACVFNDQLIVGGGYSAHRAIAGVERLTGWEWSKLPDLPTNRSAMRIMVLPDFRDFALTKIGNAEAQKRWKEEDQRTMVESNGAPVRFRGEGERRNVL